MCRPLITLVAIVMAGLLAGTAWADDSLDQKLLRATPGGDMALIRSLIAQGANVNAKNELGISPLHMAQTTDVAAMLIAKGAH